MRYIITSQQFDSFQEEGYILFEAFFSKTEIETLQGLLESAYKAHPSGRDLERGNTPLLKALKLFRIGQCILALLHKKQCKLGFTQYSPPYQGVASLKEIASVTEIYGMALINTGAKSLTNLPYLPQKVGDMSVIKETFQIDFTHLHHPLLMLVFSSENARYILQKQDPHTHLLKKLGYGFGDLLTHTTHPLLRSS